MNIFQKTIEVVRLWVVEGMTLALATGERGNLLQRFGDWVATGPAKFPGSLQPKLQPVPVRGARAARRPANCDPAERWIELP